MRTWGERQYTLIGHYINCTDLQITTDYISLAPVTSVPWMRCPLAGVRSLLDAVSSTLTLASSACPQGGESLLIGEVSRLPRVTAGVHISQMGGGVSNWVGCGVVGMRLTRATLREMRDVNPRRFGGSMFDWNRECRLGVPLLVHLNLSGTQPFLVCWPGWVRFSRFDVLFFLIIFYLR